MYPHAVYMLFYTQKDRVDNKRKGHIGKIEVVRCEASYLKEEYRPTRDITFDQANKSDALRVTDGKYTMSTTKKGRHIHRVRPYDVQLKKLWRVGPECGRLTLNYRMGHTLREMGIKLREMDWSSVTPVRRSSSHSSSGSSRSESIGTTPENSPTSSPVNLGGRESYYLDKEMENDEEEDIKPDPNILTFRIQVAN